MSAVLLGLDSFEQHVSLESLELVLKLNEGTPQVCHKKHGRLTAFQGPRPHKVAAFGLVDLHTALAEPTAPFARNDFLSLKC